MSWKPLLSPALRTTLQKIAAAYGVSVDALIDAALGKSNLDGATLAAKALAPETIAMLRAIPWPQLPAPSEEPPQLATPPAEASAPAIPPDVVITVDGVHVTCPCVSTHDELRERLVVEVPHLFAPEAPPVVLHRMIGARGIRIDSGETRCKSLDLRDGDAFLTHSVAEPKPSAPAADPPPAA